MSERSSPRLNITLPQWLVDQVALYEKAYGWKRSAIIQAALREWLQRQMPAPNQTPVGAPIVRLVAGRPYDKNKLITDYIRPEMSGAEKLQTVIEFEKAAGHN